MIPLIHSYGACSLPPLPHTTRARPAEVSQCTKIFLFSACEIFRGQLLSYVPLIASLACVSVLFRTPPFLLLGARVNAFLKLVSRNMYVVYITVKLAAYTHTLYDLYFIKSSHSDTSPEPQDGLQVLCMYGM